MDLSEKVLNGIEEVRNSGIQCPLENVEPRRCCHFPEKLIDDIVSLLEAQQAKLMTLEDIMEIYNARDCHLWPYDTAPYIFVEEHPDISTYHGSWTAWREIMAILHDGIFVHTRNTYGKTWRCWTFHPTDEQREAVKWDE